MSFCSPIYDGISCLLGRHGIREYVSQELVSVVTPSPPFSTEGLTNAGYAPHGVRDYHECAR